MMLTKPARKGIDNMSDSKTSSGSIGFSGLLTVAFIVLKLCKVIDWSWLWVVSPIWIPIAVVIGVLLITFPFFEIGKRKKRKKEQPPGHEVKSKWEQRLEEISKQRNQG